MTQPEIRIEDLRALEESLHRSEIRRSREALEDLLAEAKVFGWVSGDEQALSKRRGIG